LFSTIEANKEEILFERPLRKAKRGDKIQLTEKEKKIEVKCEIKNFRFSAHSKREELVSLVKQLNPDKIVLIHGDKEATI